MMHPQQSAPVAECGMIGIVFWRSRTVQILPICLRRTEGEYDILPLGMARRPESEPILSREDLANYRMLLARLSPHSMEGVYKTVYEECRYDGKGFHQPPRFACWISQRRHLPNHFAKAASQVTLLIDKGKNTIWCCAKGLVVNILNLERLFVSRENELEFHGNGDGLLTGLNLRSVFVGYCSLSRHC